MGHNKLDSFIADITQAVGLSEHYTNQCLHSTTITILGWLGYVKKQIRSVSGHKSSSSLEIYQKVNDQEKMAMGTDLGNILLKCKITAPGPNGNPTEQIAIPIQNAPASTTSIPNEQPAQFIQRGNEHFGSFGLSTKEPYTIMLCLSSLASSLLVSSWLASSSVHTSPWHMIRQKTSYLIHICTYVPHICTSNI